MQYSLKITIRHLGVLLALLWVAGIKAHSQSRQPSEESFFLERLKAKWVNSAKASKQKGETSKGATKKTSATKKAKKKVKKYVPPVLEDQVKKRLSKVKSDIELTYNKDVLGWVHLYTIRKREYTEEILRRTSFYFPVFEEALRRHGIPEELKYLPIVESALRPNAKSVANAVGLWQFIPSTGKSFGLQQNWLIDERMDIYKSTEAACRYLKSMNNYFKDWQLTLAAYNCGPGRVLQAVKKAKKEAKEKGKPFKRDFWRIYKHLPKETRGYVPAFIAASYTLHYYKLHNLSLLKPMQPLATTTIKVKQFVDLQKFAKALGEPYEKIKLLNIHLKRQVLTANWAGYPLRIPKNKKAFYQQNKYKILTASRQIDRHNMNFRVRKVKYFPEKRPKPDRRQKVFYVVKKGETIAAIAKANKVKATQIRLWNRIPGDIETASEGQVLLILKPRKV